MKIELPTEAEPVTVVCADVRQVLREWPAGYVNSLVTDPPYGTQADRDGYGRRQKWGGKQFIVGDCDLSAFDAAMEGASHVLTANAWVSFFCSPKNRDAAGEVCRARGLQIRGEVVWDKRSPGLGGGIRYQHETVLLASFGDAVGRCSISSVVSEWVPKGQHGHRDQYHTHEKPIGLMRQLIRYCSSPGDVIFDPFGGSGTTAVAALHEGRRCLIVEKDAGYCDVIRRRVAEAQGAGKGSLFAPSAGLFDEGRA